MNSRPTYAWIKPASRGAAADLDHFGRLATTSSSAIRVRTAISSTAELFVFTFSGRLAGGVSEWRSGFGQHLQHADQQRLSA